MDWRVKLFDPQSAAIESNPLIISNDTCGTLPGDGHCHKLNSTPLNSTRLDSTAFVSIRYNSTLCQTYTYRETKPDLFSFNINMIILLFVNDFQQKYWPKIVVDVGR